MTRCVIYCRVSTDAQERDGTSLDTQERACREYAEALGWVITSVVRDVASGFSLERQGISEVRDLASRGLVEVVLTYALDRLSRKQTHVAILVEEMEERGVRLDFVTEKFEDTATGQLLRSVKAFAAEFEREKIAERTMRGKAERARSGRLPQATGRGMFGYVYDPASGRRRINPDQAAVVRRMFEEFAAGGSLIGIVNDLNAAGERTMHGKSWTPATVFHMLRNSGYAGHSVYRRLKATPTRDPLTGKKRRRVSVRSKDEWIEVPDATPAIVPDALFATVQERLNDPERLRHGRRQSTYGLAGFIRCRRCGSAMVGQTLQGRYRYYRCRRAFSGPKHDRCDSVYVRADQLEARLIAEVGAKLSEPAMILRELTRLGEIQKDGDSSSEVLTRLDALERQRNRLLRLYQLGEIDDSYLEGESSRLKAERERLMSLLPKESRQELTIPTEVELAEMCARVRTWIEHRGLHELPLISRALQLSIHASKDGTEVSGVVPAYAPDCEHADVCSMVINFGTSAGKIPLIVALSRVASTVI